MRTYRELFRAPEYTPLFASFTVHVSAQTIGALALGTLVYDATRSPLLSALSMFGGSFAQMIGALTLLSAADRLPPRNALACMALVFAAGTAAMAVPGLPVAVLLVIVLALGLVASLGAGVRYSLLSEILPREGQILGRSVLNMSAGTMQICGFAIGGVLVATFSSRGTLLTGAVLYLLSGVLVLAGLSRRPPRATGRPSVAQTWHGNVRLLSSAPRRATFLAMWVPNGLIVGCEALFVSYSPDHAGLLLTAGAAGMLVGDAAAGRFVPHHLRERLGTPLLLLLAVPYLVFAGGPPLPLGVAAVLLASVGYASTLLFQDRLMALTPVSVHGHALALHASGMLAMQGVGAALGGGVAQLTSPGLAMAIMAAASVTITLALASGLRPLPRPQPAR
ncbi:MFS transporter [Actinomadura madurae]|uniref:MFS transporter n=3 Tax=Actinomadura madurae TaxID=1993 RepID=UPI0020271B92|nr:MFS transporter [Actinomadura madurae]MCP9955235.1 MFS transporter [Actinomadura madurae]MCQ0003974.1 MFS transporter [Actinomadura madurae]MCQ0020667.1 MFS transporter [Actinomadura madurae]URN02855.1 MFS transporter [Actinomadura madurae]